MATDTDHIQTATDSLISDALAGVNRALAPTSSVEHVIKNLEAAQRQLRAALALRRSL